MQPPYAHAHGLEKYENHRTPADRTGYVFLMQPALYNALHIHGTVYLYE